MKSLLACLKGIVESSIIIYSPHVILSLFDLFMHGWNTMQFQRMDHLQ